MSICILCSSLFSTWIMAQKIHRSSSKCRWHLWCVLADNRQWRFWGRGHERWHPLGRRETFEGGNCLRILQIISMEIQTAPLTFFWVTVGMRCVCCLTCLLYIDIPSIYFKFCVQHFPLKCIPIDLDWNLTSRSCCPQSLTKPDYLMSWAQHPEICSSS